MSKYLTIKKASNLLNVSDKTIKNWIQEKRLASHEDEKGNIVVNQKELILNTFTSICFFNQKGGVGKTSMSVILGDYFDKNNIKTLLVDLDQQGNLSQTYFDYDEIKDGLTLFDYFYTRTPLSKIVKKYNDNIDILTANIKLSRKDNISIEDLLDLKNDFIPLFKKYQIVIIDCPPALNTFSRFGILLSNYIICPVNPSAFSYDGSFEVLRTINKFIPDLNKDCIDYKFLISKHHHRRVVIKDEYVDLFKKDYQDKIFNGTIPEFVGVEERAVSFKNIFDMYSENDKSCQRIYEVCAEIDNFIFEGRD